MTFQSYFSGNEKSTTKSETSLIEYEKKPFSESCSWKVIPASLFNIIGISIYYFALTLTSVSSFEMLRGSVIIFTGINSCVFLRQRLPLMKWASMIIILIGLIFVGLADVLQQAEKNGAQNSTFANIMDSSSANIDVDSKCVRNETAISFEVVGNIMVVAAQIFYSFQFVYEEMLLSSYNITPLQMVGWEGLYGLIIMLVTLVLLSYIDTSTCAFSTSPSPPWKLADPIDGFVQLGNNWQLLSLFCSSALLVPFKMFASISVTKELNATTRMVFESIKCVIVWIVSLCVGWQHFQYLQLIGFCIMTTGIFIYNR